MKHMASVWLKCKKNNRWRFFHYTHEENLVGHSATGVFTGGGMPNLVPPRKSPPNNINTVLVLAVPC